MNAGQPNLLIMGPDLNEPNENQANATFVGSGATLQIQHASIFPNYQEFPGVPSDNDYYRVVAQTTGTLDFQVYFQLFDPTLLPGGGNLNLEVLDGNGNVIASAPGTLGAVGTTANARVRIPAVAGQSYFLRVFGQPPVEGQSAVVNGYDVTIIDTPPPVPFDVELSRTVLAVALTSGGSGYASPPTVTFTGGGPSAQAVATAILSGGTVVDVDITSASGFTSTPTVVFTGGGGTAQPRRLPSSTMAICRPAPPTTIPAVPSSTTLPTTTSRRSTCAWATASSSTICRATARPI